MSLKDRLNKSTQNHEQEDIAYDLLFQTGEVSAEFVQLKERMHALLIEKVNSTPTWVNYSDEEQKELIRQFIDNRLETSFKSVPLNRVEKERLVREIVQETKGYGPLDPLLDDPNISDILVNGAKSIYVEKNGKLTKTKITFKDNNHLKNIIERIVSKVGRRIDEQSPMVDARLPDGSRVNAIIPPLAIDGPSLSIRKFKGDAGSLTSLLKWGAISVEMAEFLKSIVKARANIVISGGTGAGKTTLLNSLSEEIPHDERIITIEDSAELSLKQDHVVRLETRPPNIEGTGQIAARDLVINALRMRPDRIVVGECRGSEALDMLQAMNTGHDGSLTTLHANSPRDALSRLETMVLFAGINLPDKNIKSQISSAVDFIIQVSRLSDGTRKITSVSEITGMEESVISMQEIFRFEQIGVENGKVIGVHVSTGTRPEFIEKMAVKGINVELSIFNKEHKHTYINHDSATIVREMQDTAPVKARLMQQNNALAQRLRR